MKRTPHFNVIILVRRWRVDILFDIHEQWYELILNGGEGRWKDDMDGSVIFDMVGCLICIPNPTHAQDRTGSQI